MAGIGFQLKKITQKRTLSALLKAYGYSAALSSGPWVISMIVIFLIGFINIYYFHENDHTVKFQVIVTYAMMMASSLIFTGFLQLPFTRYIADRIFEGEEKLVLPNYLGVLVVVLSFGFFIALPLSEWLFFDQNPIFIILSVAIFLVLSCVWISNILAVSLRFYRFVILSYAIAYMLILMLSIMLKDHGIEGLLFSFLCGNSLLFILLMMAIIRQYPSCYFVRFDFFEYRTFYWTLGFAGLFYNLGAWADKIIFWYHPLTGVNVIGRLNGSVLYDMPIFLAYLSIIPGMAVFFYRLEVEFAEKYDLYYSAVRMGGVLEQIERHRRGMMDVVRTSIREILTIQGVFNLGIFMVSVPLFKALKIPQLFLPLFYIDLIGTQIQLGFMSILAFLFYIDRRREAMNLSILFFLLNILFTIISIELGPYYFGYGFAFSLLIVFIGSLYYLKYIFERLNYETFMLQ